MQALSKRAKRRQNRQKRLATVEGILRPLQGQNLTFAKAYTQVQAQPQLLGFKEGTNYSYMLRELGTKTVLSLLKTAKNSGAITNADYAAAIQGGKPDFSNSTAWKVLEAGVIDDLPGLSFMKDVIKHLKKQSGIPGVIGRSAEWVGALPYIRDTFNTKVAEVAEKARLKNMPILDVRGDGQEKEFSAIVPILPRNNGRPAEVRGLSYDSIDSEAISAFVCPERYFAKLPWTDVEKTALSSGSASFSLNTNASGNCAVTLFPNSLAANNVAYTYNDATYNPVNGTQTPSGTGVSGPLVTFASQIFTLRTNFFSVKLNFVQSALNNSGTVQACFFSQYPTDGWASGPYLIPQGQLAQLPYYQVGSMRDVVEIRYTRPLGSDNELTLLPEAVIPGFAEGFTFVCTGGAASVTIATVTYSWSVEYVPIASWQALIPIAYPNVAPATVSAIRTLTQVHPGLIMLKTSESSDLAQSILGSRISTYPQIFRYAAVGTQGTDVESLE